jgi:hypothetical protein
MWPFKTKRKPDLPTLIFKSGESFFEMQCKYGHTDIRKNVGIVALVLDAEEMFGTSEAVKIDERGIQTATLRVAAEDGGFLTIAQTASAKGDELSPGDVVVWVPSEHLPQMGNAMGDHRSGWVGLIVARVAPEMDPRSNELTLICRY